MSEPVSNADELESLRAELAAAKADLDAAHRRARHGKRLRADLAQRTAERDEARRRICNDSLRMGRVFRRIEGQNVECSTPQDVAEMMGWDCFDAPHANTGDVPVQDGGSE